MNGLTIDETGGFPLQKLKWLLASLESGRREIGDINSFEDSVLSIGGEHIGWKGEWLLENPRYISREYFESMSSGIVHVNDVLLVKDGATIGKVAIAQSADIFDAAVNEHVFLLRFNTHQVPRFHFYSLQSSFVKQQIACEIRGAAQPGLNSEFQGMVLFPVPSQAMQEKIANALDRETARIDRLITEKERMLALLEEKRSALISRLVIRGLNPNIPLKPSGQEWLGDIPAHWELRRVKFVTAWLDQGSSPVAANMPAGPDEFGVLKLSAVSKGRFKREENKALHRIDDEEQPLTLRKGDVLITRGNTPELVADVAYVPNDEPNLLLPDLIYRLRVREEKILAEYLTIFLTTATARVQIRRDARGSSGSMVKVSQGHVLDWLTPLPPLSEQREIVDCLRDEDERFQSVVKEISSSLSLLSERRAALIDGAVTGQINFRG